MTAVTGTVQGALGKHQVTRKIRHAQFVDRDMLSLDSIASDNLLVIRYVNLQTCDLVGERA